MTYLIIYLVAGLLVAPLVYRIDQVAATKVEHPLIILVGVLLWPILYIIVVYSVFSDHRLGVDK